MIVVYTLETSTISGTGTYDLDGAYSDFNTFVAALQVEQSASPMPTTWADVNYTAWTTTGSTPWDTYDEVEVGRGTITDAATDTLSRADANVSYSTTSNNRVDWPVGKTIYIACTLNVWQLENP